MPEKIDPEQIRLQYGPPEIRENDYFNKDDVELLLPRGYKTSLLIGDPASNLAMITGWGDPWHAVPEEVIKRLAVVASLRIPMGVDLMLRNLAANPHITGIAIYAGRSTDNTEVGLYPRRIMRAIWDGGLQDDGTVEGSDGYKLSPELVDDGAIEVVKKVVKNVSVHDWSDQPKDALPGLIDAIPKKDPYMEPVALAEFKVVELETFPSERVGIVVREKNGFEALLKLEGNILRFGRNSLLETNAAVQIRELPFARVVLESSDPFAHIPEWALDLTNLKLGSQDLENYYHHYIRPEEHTQEIFPGIKRFERPAGEKYSYAELLFAFPRLSRIDRDAQYIAAEYGIDAVLKFLGNGVNISEEMWEQSAEVMRSGLDPQKTTEVLLEILRPPVNQVAEAIERIKTIPDDADKMFITWDPNTHGAQFSGRPCLIEMGYLVRNGRIDANATFRTHDIAKGWIFNAYGLSRLLQDVAAETGYQAGSLVISSESAHIYDADRGWVKELWDKQIGGQEPSYAFNPEKADPRGDITINIVDGQIQCQLLEPKTGKSILTFAGSSYRDLSSFIRHHDLISQPDHAIDIGAQLFAAEMSLRFDTPFVQDQLFKVYGDLDKRLGL
jgi:tetrahydromethanopterin S-methyltransferase subunit A